MKKNKPITVFNSFLSLLFVTLVLTTYISCTDSSSKRNFPTINHRVAYINIEKAKNTDRFIVCDSTYIVDYYNYSPGDSIYRATSYANGKNGLRKEVLTQYKNNNYSDSGYLNFRFIVNCHGEAGAYVIHENDLDLKPKSFNPDLVEQLFNITVSLKEWLPNFMRGENRDSYMYISYRIENGEITEIIP